MAIYFETVILGKPASANASSTDKASWRSKVETHCKSAFSAKKKRTSGLSLHIVHFPPSLLYADVDNIIKYTQDGMKNVVFDDDKYIEHVSSRRINPRPLVPITPVDLRSVPVLLAALKAQSSKDHAVAVRVRSKTKLSRVTW